MGLSDLFGKKVFGLKEAKRVEDVEGAHIPTLKAVLKALDVPNIVASEIAKSVLIHRAKIQTTSEENIRIQSEDLRDEKETTEVIKATQAAHEWRKRGRNDSVRVNKLSVLGQQLVIEELEALKKYA